MREEQQLWLVVLQQQHPLSEEQWWRSTWGKDLHQQAHAEEQLACSQRLRRSSCVSNKKTLF
jgi:hypothetical protein